MKFFLLFSAQNAFCYLEVFSEMYDDRKYNFWTNNQQTAMSKNRHILKPKLHQNHVNYIRIT